MQPIYNKILSVVGNVITVRASGVSYEELAEITTERGKSLAQVIKIEDDDLVYLQVFEVKEFIGEIFFNIWLIADEQIQDGHQNR